jgi:hypothetical protein
MSSAKGRTQRCSPAQAQTRLDHARKFLEVAELVASEGDSMEYSSAGASLAVLAGIAASDAACCKALGRRSRGQDHREAVDLIAQIEPGGKQAGKALRRLIDLKDEAQYGLFDIGGQDLRAVRRQARALLKFAEEVLRR